MRGGEERFLAAVERMGQRVRPIVEQHCERRVVRFFDPMSGYDEERGFADGTDETERLPNAERLVEPGERVLRAVGDFRPPDQPLEEANAGAEKFLFVLYCAADRNTYPGHAGGRCRV